MISLRNDDLCLASRFLCCREIGAVPFRMLNEISQRQRIKSSLDFSTTALRKEGFAPHKSLIVEAFLFKRSMDRELLIDVVHFVWEYVCSYSLGVVSVWSEV